MILYTVSWINTIVYKLSTKYKHLIDITVVFYKSYFLIQNPRCPAPAEYYTFNLYSQHHLLRIFIIWKSHKENVGAISEKKRIVCMNEMKSFMGVKCLIIVSMQTYLKSITVRTDSLLSQIPLRHWVPCGGLDNYRYQLSEFLSDVRKPEQRGGCQIVITRN